MAVRFAVLSSSSSGNASYLDVDGHGVLVDFGVGPRKLTRLLDCNQVGWDSVRAVVLTHLHSDHWNENTLNLMAQTGTPLWCHVEHAAELERRSEVFHDLARAGLVRHYQANQTFDLGSCTCTPLPLWHDVVTFGFRFDGAAQPWALGYASDLGSWAGDLVDRLAEVDLLALEFNHDVDLQLTSERCRQLIDRVLGDEGHLSNRQACNLLGEILRRTAPGRLRHVVALHLSRDCNRPDLVQAAAAKVRDEHQADFVIHPADHSEPTPWFPLRVRPSFASATHYEIGDMLF
jgi:phosphoribosyl 1,2-cyclic phosphodiesterase